jgi:uncharacterized protein
MSAERVIYLDSSAIVKLVIREAESSELRAFLRSSPRPVSSALAVVEVRRAVAPYGPASDSQARKVLATVDLVRIGDDVLDSASSMGPHALRSLDAIHLATAALFEDTLTGIITYDNRMASAAQDRGFAVVRPS